VIVFGDPKIECTDPGPNPDQKASPQLYIRCGRVVTDFDWEAKNRFNF